MIGPVIQAVDLSVSTADGRPIVSHVSLAMHPGELIGVIGESGSGKSTLALALLGYAKGPSHISARRLQVDGKDLLALDQDALRRLRGPVAAYVAQDPAMVLNPMMRIGRHLHEALHAHFPRLSVSERRERVTTISKAVGLPEDQAFWRRFPHQLSGGQQQRVVLALAFILEPRLIILDEPTTALDVMTQALILDTIRELCRSRGVAALFISHDLAVVAGLVDRLLVMHEGQIVETAPTNAFLAGPSHPYSRALLAAAPRLNRDAGEPPVLRGSREALAVILSGVHKRFGEMEVLRCVDLRIGAGRCAALVGASGSGKTSLARILAGLDAPDAGAIWLFGEPVPEGAARSAALRRRVQYIFQNPYRSLNPRRRVGEILRSVASHFYDETSSVRERRVLEALSSVALDPTLLERYPRALSGGERQRVAIARALIGAPDLLICDEITSALDVAAQAKILELLKQLKSQGLALLFVTHDLGVAQEIADDIAVLEQGIIVERGTVNDVLMHPAHDYTKALVDSAPLLPSSDQHS